MTIRATPSAGRRRWAGRAAGAPLILGFLALAACSDRGQRGPAPPAEGAPTPGGTLVIAGPNDLDFANTLVSGEVYTQELLRNALFMPLIRYNAEQRYEPYLAKSWELLGDTGVVFRLREDVFWHDGARTTAHDVAFTYQRAKDPLTAFPNVNNYFGRWGTVEVLDSFTVRFNFEPHPDPLAGLPYFPIMPRHKLESVPPARLRQVEFNKNPVGNGPFRFVSYQPNDRWIFEANPDFPEELGGRPYLDRVVWRVVPERTARVTELLTGTVDLVVSPPSQEIKELDARPEIRAIVRSSPQYQFIAWNGKRPPFNDARVRRALSLAIDREEVLQLLRAGYGELAIGPVYPQHWAYDRALAPLPYDTAAAKALLAEAGFQDRDGNGALEDAKGKELAFALTIPANNEYNKDVAEMVQADLATVGVRLTLRPTEASTLFADIESPERRFDAFYLQWQSDFRLNIADLFHSSALGGRYQFASYSNPEIDRILDGAGMAPNQEAALPLWHRLQAIMREEQPYTFFFYVPDMYLAGERVRGVEMDIRGAFINLPRWWIAGGEPVVARGGGE